MHTGCDIAIVVINLISLLFSPFPSFKIMQISTAQSGTATSKLSGQHWAAFFPLKPMETRVQVLKVTSSPNPKSC